MENSITATMASASQGMRAQSLRLRIASENLSNVDTPGYHRKLVTFRNVVERNVTGDSSEKQSLIVDQVSLDQTPRQRVFDPAHPLADENGYVTMSNVDMMVEMADAREASRSYEANLATFQQARKMFSGLLDLIRR